MNRSRAEWDHLAPAERAVRADPVDTPVAAALTKVTNAEPTRGKVAAGSAGYSIDGPSPHQAFRYSW